MSQILNTVDTYIISKRTKFDVISALQNGNPDVGEGGIVTDISKDARAELYKR